MLLVDTSLWVATYRDPSGGVSARVQAAMGGEDHVFCQMTRIELLQGCRNEKEWEKTLEFLDDQEYRELGREGWTDAAKMYFDYRRQGDTVRSTLDCCIAQSCLDHDATLLHTDRDFEVIATIRPLKQRRIEIQVP